MGAEWVVSDFNGGPAPGYSSGQAQAAVERIAAEVLPRGIKFEWMDLTLQQVRRLRRCQHQQKPAEDREVVEESASLLAPFLSV